jgi:hypothetical protein
MEAHKSAGSNRRKPAKLQSSSDLLEARRLWLEENREAIQAYNEHVEQHGVFSAGLRGF